MVTDCSFIKLPVGGNGTDDLASGKVNFRIAFAIIEAALESMKQNKYNDLEVSDLPQENAKVDELARHVHYTAKAIRKLTLPEAKSSVPFPPTGSRTSLISPIDGKA
jgi:hypothetical protein